jgi:hypothetical protein
MSRSAPLAASAVAMLGLLLTGCRDAHPDRPRTFPVSGRVLHDGKPAAGARVQLNTVGGGLTLVQLCPHAEVSADGSFRLTTFRTDDGAPVGTYALTLTWPSPPPRGRDEGPDRFKGRYADPRKPLRQVHVVAGENVLEPIILK